MIDITSVGEILIDLTQTGVNANGVPRYDANPGGAPANLAVAASRLGAKTAFLGKVGKDRFGAFLKETLKSNGVETVGVVEDERERTTLAVVSVDETGERSFAFYREPSADVNLRAAELSLPILTHTRILHFGSVSTTAEPAREATYFAARTAKSAGAWISYDPNYRASLWRDERTAVAQMKEALPLVDILKVSDNELPLLTGETDPEIGSRKLIEQGIRLVFVTLGDQGAFYRCGNVTGVCPAQRVRVADTNGAGDTFFGAALSRLCRLSSLDGLDRETLEAITAFSNRAAAMTASRPGAIPAMPTLDELQ